MTSGFKSGGRGDSRKDVPFGIQTVVICFFCGGGDKLNTHASVKSIFKTFFSFSY